MTEHELTYGTDELPGSVTCSCGWNNTQLATDLSLSGLRFKAQAVGWLHLNAVGEAPENPRMRCGDCGAPLPAELPRRVHDEVNQIELICPACNQVILTQQIRFGSR